MKSNKIYVVIGSTGEYDSYEEWAVKAYFSKKKAKEHAKNATRRAKEIMATHQKESYHIPFVPEYANEYDMNMQVDYTGTKYCVWEIEIGDEQ